MSKTPHRRSTTTRIAVTRSTDATPVKGNLLKVSEPAFISLVNSPANQRPFPVIRSDDQAGKAGATKTRRAKRNDNPVLSLIFPVGYAEADVLETLDKFDMDGYSVAEADGCFVATRSDLQSTANINTKKIRLTSDGIMASVEASDNEGTAPTDEIVV